MRVSRIGLALVGALLAVGCSEDDGPFLATQVPLAYTRFINAIPDTASRLPFVDLIEYSPLACKSLSRFTPIRERPRSAAPEVFTIGANIFLPTRPSSLTKPRRSRRQVYTLAPSVTRTAAHPMKLQVYEDPFRIPAAT
jgi:hypothetical protein